MKRNYGIDSLRIFSMFMVVVIHILGNGGILSACTPGSPSYWVSWFLEISGYFCTNGFALISGYVLYQSRFKLSRAIDLWLQTVFYSLSIALLFVFLLPSAVGGKAFVYSLFPITSRQYWYISAYFGVLLLSPILNCALKHIGKKELGCLLLSAFVLFSVLPSFLQRDPYSLVGGYSLIWLALLYLTGGYLHKYSPFESIKSRYIWLVIFLMTVLSFLLKFIIEQFLTGIPFVSLFKNIFIGFTAPTIVIISVGLLVVFSRISVAPKLIGLVRFLSPAILGVYLTHVNPFVWDNLFKDFATGFVNYNCIIMVCLVFLTSAGIFLAGILIDRFRILLFKLTRLDRLSTLIERRIQTVFQKQDSLSK